MTAEEVLNKNCGGINTDEEGDNIYYKWEVLRAMKEYAELVREEDRIEIANEIFKEGNYRD